MSPTQFLIGSFWLVLLSFMSSSYIMMLTPYWTWFCKQFLSFIRLSFRFDNGFVQCSKTFEFGVVPFIFAFTSFDVWVRTIRASPRPMLIRLLYFSRNFTVSDLIFKSFNPFWVNFICYKRKQSSLILLNVAVQVFEHHLLKSQPLVHCMISSFVVIFHVDEIFHFYFAYFCIE